LSDNCGKNIFIGSKNPEKSEKNAKNGKKMMGCLVSRKIK
jgi:hypothetical protein